MSGIVGEIKEPANSVP